MLGRPIGTVSVEAYVALEQRRVSVSDIPKALRGAAALALDGKLLVIGGDNHFQGGRSAVLEYDPEHGSWKTLPSLLTARKFCNVTVLGGDVVVLGGYGPNLAYLASVERYNRRSHRWEAMPSLTDTLTSTATMVVQV